MSGFAPALPPLPPGFGNQSSYPPHPSASSSALSSQAAPPPLPPLPAGALEREHQLRAQNLPPPQPSSSSSPSYSSSARHPSLPPQLPSLGPPSSGFVPDQIIHNPSFHANATSQHLQPVPARYTRLPSPSPSPSSFFVSADSAPLGFPQPQPHRLASNPAPCPYPHNQHHPQRNNALSPPPQPTPPDRPHSVNSFHAGGGGGGGFASPAQHLPLPSHHHDISYLRNNNNNNNHNGGAASRPHSYVPDSSMPTMPALSQSISNIGFGAPPSSYPQQPAGHHTPYTRRASSSEATSTSSFQPPQQQQQPQRPLSPNSGAPSLNAPLPDLDALQKMRDRAWASRDDQQQVAWAKQFLKFVERKFTDGSKISEPRLVKCTDDAISTIKRLASMSRPNLEALYLRGDLQASGAFPTYIPKDLKEAFNDFELSARLGFAASWFRIGRDYELLNDFTRARDAYNRGVGVGDVGSMYRLGMANLLGQLEMAVHQAKAVSMLREAADRANLDVPQPAYIYGMLLAGEFNHVDIPPGLLKPSLPADGSSSSTGRNNVGRGGNDTKAALEAEARRRIERAAFLNFAPAQYKCGWNYEYAQLDCAFNPLLSVQYYSLASQGGEVEADMALSKWFLCGADGCFDKNETLAFTFADRAARKGLASAEFALGYYYEVGVGIERNLETAKRWYRKAAAQDNEDAKERIRALQAGGDHALSRGDHEVNVDEKVQRKRTLARIRSEKEGRGGVGGGGGTAGRDQTTTATTTTGGGGDNGWMPNGSGNGSGGTTTELNRKKTMRMVEETAAGGGRRVGGRRNAAMEVPMMPPLPEQYANASPPSTRIRPSAQASSSNGGANQHDLIPFSTLPTQGRYGTGYSLSDSPVSQTRPAQQQQQQQQMSSSGSATSKQSGGGQQAKVYSTFEEMGFKPQKAKKDECIVA